MANEDNYDEHGMRIETREELAERFSAFKAKVKRFHELSHIKMLNMDAREYPEWNDLCVAIDEELEK